MKATKYQFAVLCLVASMSATVHAQIPVTDAIQNGQTATHNMATVAQWAKEIAEMKMQYDMLTQQYGKMEVMEGLVSGSRALGVNNTPGINGAIPNQVGSIYSGSFGDTKSIMSTERVQATNRDTQNQLRERSFQSAAAEKALALNTFAGAQERLENINSLIVKVGNSKDPKTTQDLQARIGAEQALIQTETTKLQMVSQLAKSEEKLVNEKRQQMNRDILNPENTGMPGIK